MKKILLLLLLLSVTCIVNSIYGQKDEKLDTIIKLNDEIITCKVTSITEKEVIYSFQGETLSNSLSKNQIKEIHLSNERVQKFSELIIIKGEEDWEKVQITNIESEISGLVKKGDVAGKANAATIFSSVDDMKLKAEMKMKKHAASMGAHIIFIKSTNSTQAAYGMNTAKANISGVAFGYK
jgi:hypothetical protein